MKFLLLIAVLAVLSFIATEGSPLPKQENNSEEDTTDQDETDKETEVKETKTKSNKGKRVKSTPEPVIEEEENQFYVMVPTADHGKKNKPFNFKRIPKSSKPKYGYKPYPTLPFPYPMFQDNQELIDPETEIEFSLPNMMKMTAMTDDLPMFYMPSRRRPYGNGGGAKQTYQSPFIVQNKDSWNPYLESSGYYK